jgi:hypothetical protein
MVGGSRQVFISYARSDGEQVDALVEGLRQLHYDAWVDEELTGGQAWWDTVLTQIRASSAVLVALSPASLESVAVRREYEYAHAVGRPLMPVVVGEVQLETLPSLLAPLQVVDYCQPDTRSAFALAAALAALPAPRALPRPLPEPPSIPVSYLGRLKEHSQAAALSMDEQLALVARLKVALGRATERQAAEEILRSLQNRNDLYEMSAREIETILPRRAPVPGEASKASLRKSSAREWSVKRITGPPGKLVLELQKHDRHVLEFHNNPGEADLVILDGKQVQKFTLPFTNTKTVEFQDGDEIALAKITVQGKFVGGRLKSFQLRLDNELVYRFP